MNRAIDLQKKNDDLAQLILEGLIKNQLDAETYSRRLGHDSHFARQMTFSPIRISLSSLRRIAIDLKIENALIDLLI